MYSGICSCGHYFCEKCALEQYRKSPKCYVCGKNTGGCFNKATNIIERLEKKHQVDEEEEEEENDVGEPSDEDMWIVCLESELYRNRVASLLC